MAKICVIIDVPHKSLEELRQLVHDDEAEYDDSPVAVEYVDPIDILTLVRIQPNRLGGAGYDIIYQSMED